MIKAHKRKNSGSMRRASRVYLTDANVGKVAELRSFLLRYVKVVNYFIERFWSMKDFTPALADEDDADPERGEESGILGIGGSL